MLQTLLNIMHSSCAILIFYMSSVGQNSCCRQVLSPFGNRPLFNRSRGDKRKFLFLGDGPLGREYEVHVVNCAGWVHNNSWSDNVHLWEMTWEWSELQSWASYLSVTNSQFSARFSHFHPCHILICCDFLHALCASYYCFEIKKEVIMIYKN